MVEAAERAGGGVNVRTSPLLRFVYTSHDGSEWIIRSGSLEAARSAAHVAEKRATGSIAAGMVAARSVRRY